MPSAKPQIDEQKWVYRLPHQQIEAAKRQIQQTLKSHVVMMITQRVSDQDSELVMFIGQLTSGQQDQLKQAMASFESEYTNQTPEGLSGESANLNFLGD